MDIISKSKQSLSRFNNKYLSNIDYPKILKICKFIILGVIILGYVYFLLNKQYYTNVYSDLTEFFALKKFVGTTFIFIALIFILFWKNNLSDRINKRLLYVLLILAPCGLFFAIEYIHVTSLFRIELFRVLLNLLIIYLVIGFGFIISGSVKVGIVLGTIITCLFGLASYFLYNFRVSPLLYSDFADIATAGNVLHEYSYALNFRAFIFIVACFAICLVTCKLKSNKPLGWKKRVMALVIYTVALTGTVYSVVISNIWGDNHIHVSTFRPLKSYHKNGSYLTLLRSAKITMVNKPEGYSVATVEKITSEYEAKYAKEAAQSPDNNSEYRRPNVIAIMNESFTDIQGIGEYFETNTEVMPFYNSLEENTIKGNVYASKIGSGTANSEFEFMTGNSLSFLPLGTSPYQLFIKNKIPSLNSTLIAQDYQGITALHPYQRDGYNRIKVYEFLEFNKFLGEENFKDPLMYRDFISDEASYDKIIEEYEKSKKESKEPFYLFNVTMQNHGSYSKDYKNFPLDVYVTEEDFLPVEQGENRELDKLLTLMNKSDQAIKELVEYFKEQDDETIIIFFGDHQPAMSTAFYNRVFKEKDSRLTSEELMQKYKVPFFIWANFDIQEATHDRCSFIYLQSLAFEAAGMEMTDYQKYLLDLYKEMPVLTVFGHYDNNDVFYNTEDKIVDTNEVINPDAKEKVKMKTPQDPKLNEYNMLVYNNLFDNKNRINSFFYLKEYDNNG